MFSSPLKKLAVLATFTLTSLSNADVISPTELQKLGLDTLSTFEAVATVDYLSEKPKSAKELKAEDFENMKNDALFKAIAALEFSWFLNEKSQKCVEASEILKKLEATLNKDKNLDHVQNFGVSVININILNNLSAKIDDSKLKASAFVGSTKNVKTEREPALNINLVLKTDGSCYSPSVNEIQGAINAIPK